MNSLEPSCGTKPGEELTDLQLNGLKLIQKRDAFRFGTDAVLLADFTKLKSGARVADFGTGTGIIPVLLCGHHADITVHAIEIQPDMAEMAERSVRLNGLEARISVHEADIKTAAQELGYNRFDTVTCNPPYYGQGTGAVSGKAGLAIARSDALISLDEICQSACAVLKSGGRLSLVYPAKYLPGLIESLRAHSLEPKRLRTVHYMASRAPKLILMDAVKGGGAQLDWLPPLILKNEDGSDSSEWKRIYG